MDTLATDIQIAKSELRAPEGVHLPESARCAAAEHFAVPSSIILPTDKVEPIKFLGVVNQKVSYCMSAVLHHCV
jgi:hypothetical protein